MEIRPLTIDDHADMIALWENSDLEHKPLGRDRYDLFKIEMERDPDLFLGGFEDDVLVGTIIASFDGRKGWMNRLAIHPEKRNRGYAKLLVKEAEKRLREKGARIIGVLVYDSNSPSLELFKLLGYEVFDGVTYLTKRDDPEV